MKRSIKSFTKQNLRPVYDVIRSIHHGTKESKWRKSYEKQNMVCHKGDVQVNHQIAKIYVEPSTKRLNLIFKSFTVETLNNSKEFLTIATEFAQKKHFAFRIISRNNLPNPKDYYCFATSQNLALPDSISFYTDCMSRVSTPTYRFETTAGDVFFTENEITELKEFIKNEK